MREETKRAFEELRARRLANEIWVEALEGVLTVLERRGYDVRGKTVDEIKEIIRKPPTRARSDDNETPQAPRDPSEQQCSFCGKTNKQVTNMVGARWPDGFICGECVALAAEAVGTSNPEWRDRLIATLTKLREAE